MATIRRLRQQQSWLIENFFSLPWFWLGFVFYGFKHDKIFPLAIQYPQQTNIGQQVPTSHENHSIKRHWKESASDFCYFDIVVLKMSLPFFFQFEVGQAVRKTFGKEALRTFVGKATWNFCCQQGNFKLFASLKTVLWRSPLQADAKKIFKAFFVNGAFYAFLSESLKTRVCSGFQFIDFKAFSFWNL